MYAEEVGAIVIDSGSTSIKGGYAGNDTPSAIVPSACGVVYHHGNTSKVGEGQKEIGSEMDVENASSKNKNTYYIDTDKVNYRRDHMEIIRPINAGVIEDWDTVERLWQHTLNIRLRVRSNEHPLLMSEVAYNTKQDRQKLTELLFEKYEVPAFYLSKSPVLSSFAAGRANGLVVEMGGGHTTIVPVYDGYIMPEGIVRTGLTGDLLNEEWLQELSRKNVPIQPHYKFKKLIKGDGIFQLQQLNFENTTQSFDYYMRLSIVEDMKKSLCKLADATFIEEENLHIPTTPYELPDGTMLEIGTSRFRIPEILFNPDLCTSVKDKPMALHTAIYESARGCDVDTRKDLLNAVMLTGAGSIFGTLKERLERELTILAAPANKVKIISNNPVERAFGAWIGGSILASLGSFQKLWISKAEYGEYGSVVVNRKCP